MTSLSNLFFCNVLLSLAGHVAARKLPVSVPSLTPFLERSAVTPNRTDYRF